MSGDKLKIGDATRRIDTTIEDLRPAAQAVVKKEALEIDVPRTPQVEKRRAPLIELFGVKIDVDRIRERVAKGLHAIADPLIISFIINAGGSAFAYFAMGVPFDAKLAAMYGVIGTVVGTAYFPVKQALVNALKSSSPAPDGEPEAP